MKFQQGKVLGKMKTTALVTMALLAVAQVASAADQHKGDQKDEAKQNTSEQGPPYSLLNFRIAGIDVFQTAKDATTTTKATNGSSVYSLILSYNPEYRLMDNLYVGLNLGGTILSNRLNENFFVAEYQATGGYLFTPSFGAELGAGAQTWFTHGGTYFLPSVTGFYKFADKSAGYLDRIFAGYSAYTMPSYFTHELKLGVGFSF